MKNRPYKRKPGDFEIRILSDGKVVMIVPDETLVEIARVVNPKHYAMPPKKMETKENVGCRTNKAR